MKLRSRSVFRSPDMLSAILIPTAIVVPIVAICWLVTRGVENERLAARHRLMELRTSDVAAARRRVGAYFNQFDDRWQRRGRTPVGVFFEAVVTSGQADGIVIRDANARQRFPIMPTLPKRDSGDVDADFRRAERLESSQQNYAAAAQVFEALAYRQRSIHERACAFHAAARCRVHAGNTEQAIELLIDLLHQPELNVARDMTGRFVVPNARMMLLDLIGEEHTHRYTDHALALARAVADYQVLIPSTQRTFLMQQLRERGVVEFPTLAAERLSLAVAERLDDSMQAGIASPVVGGHVWTYRTRDGLCDFALRETTMIYALDRAVNTQGHAAVALLRPNVDADDSSVVRAAGDQLPGWRLASLQSGDAFVAAHESQHVVRYLGGGAMLIGVLIVIGCAGISSFNRRLRLTRLKNDLIANVSHELKTPLASTRLLVDTLLEQGDLPAEKTRDYLQLVHRENERLCRLVESFLTFSRLERNTYRFKFVDTSVGDIVEQVRELIEGRFDIEAHQLTIDIERPGTVVHVDVDAIVTAILNLVENAFKYSPAPNQTVVRVRADDGVRIEVVDTGIGLTRSAKRRIFTRFFQVDQTLSRSSSGCGLGLSIVDHILRAHKTGITLRSEPGKGSTFAFTLPLAGAVSS